MTGNDRPPSTSPTGSSSGSTGSGGSERSGLRVTPKEIVALVVAVAAVVFALLNDDKHEVNVFGWKPDTYTWLFFLIMLVLGVLIGLLLPFGRSGSRKKK